MNLAASIARKLLVCAGVVLVCGAFVWANETGTPTRTTATSAKKTGRSSKASTRRKKSRRASWRRGQQKVDPQRAREIQEALIREHYLKGTPSGKWDEATQAAMQRYQAANGWQIKTVPDARALIKLGLGPNHDHLLNPESAMTTAPQPRSASASESSSQASDPQK